MTKTPISRDALRDKVLATIREHPGCEAVKEVAITPVEIVDIGTTWHVNVIDNDGVQIELACTIARQVQEKLNPLFEVSD